ncbi:MULTISPECIES: hypothetical protein [unclassified Moorena]|uniref:hypothetical protein n=1 Tax=unclassified Moorena TaxID=2683338 RepID=UPI0025EE82ED|nr:MULTISPECIES: hypothetical protein [unclassified Moorena]
MKSAICGHHATEAFFDHNVGHRLDGEHRCNLVLAKVKGVFEPWAVITDEPPTLLSLWQYGFRFEVEELFLDSKSGAKELEDSRIRSAQALERLYERGSRGLTLCYYRSVWLFNFFA